MMVHALPISSSTRMIQLGEVKPIHILFIVIYIGPIVSLIYDRLAYDRLKFPGKKCLLFACGGYRFPFVES